MHAMVVMLSLTTMLSPSSIEARMGALKTHHANVKYHHDDSHPSLAYSDDIGTASQSHPLSFLEESSNLAPPQASNSRRGGLTASIRTAVADLAGDFQSAIQAFNQDDNNIHVGKLLTACERLEDTMRKIGFTQGAKDIGGNIRKIRNMYNIAPPSQRDSMPLLLRYEMEIGVHNDENNNNNSGGGGSGIRRMKDPSAAIGFLWLGRTLNYQYDLFRLMLDENEDPYNAARRAYEQDLKQHHSWAVQKVCQAAMVTLKPMRKTAVLSSLGGFEEDRFGQQEHDATHRDLNEMMNSWKPLLCRWRKVFSDLELESI